MRRASISFVTIVVAVCVLLAGVRAQEPALIAVQPGDVLRVDGSMTVLGKKWIALVGIDLDVKPGTYPATIVRGEPGSTPRAAVLTVRAKAFPVRRLRVAPDFVNPPAEEMERIVADNKKTAAILARVTPRHWTGAFILPVDQKPTSNFGTRSFYNGERRSPHAGVDFLSGTGTPVRAANDGVVALAEPLYFTGNTVMVDYGNGLYSLFAHLSEFRVHEGDTVKADTVVGLVGATGRVTGPHLHWAVRLQGARVDPLSLVAASQ